MPGSDRLCETEWLQRVLNTLLQFRNARSPPELADLRDQLTPLVWDDRAPRAANFASEGDRFRRHPLATVEALGCSALLMYWPAGHATLPHDHGGLWGIEIVIDGNLDVDEYLKSGSPEAPMLTLGKSLRLGVGDAAMFTGGDYVHRCRNRSNVAPSLTLHVYGGALHSYTSFESNGIGDVVPQQQIARSDRILS